MLLPETFFSAVASVVSAADQKMDLGLFQKSAVTLAFTGSNQSQVADDGNERTEKEGGIDGYNC